MILRNLNFSLRFSSHRIITQLVAKNATSAAAESTDEKDPAPYYFSEKIQKLLKTVTRANPDKVFRRQLDGRELEAPQYKFMTDEQLKKALLTAEQEMWEFLQMPPVVKVRKEQVEIYSKDPALQGYSDAKFVFTDITYGISNKNRLVAVREPDGTLRSGTNEEKDRLNQIYFPVPGREVEVPKMFQDEYLQDILNREEYEFVLNRTCVQFDPDHPDYHRVTKITYDLIDVNMHHDRLRSTRHFGPMVFYLAWNKKIDNLLLENIMAERIEDAALVIRLYYELNPSEKAIEEDDNIKLIEHFIKNETGLKRKLDQALKKHLELEDSRKKVQENINKIHGRTERMKNRKLDKKIDT